MLRKAVSSRSCLFQAGLRWDQGILPYDRLVEGIVRGLWLKHTN